MPDSSECQHEAPPYPEPYWDDIAEPLNPPRFDPIAPCIHCGIPLRRPRNTQMVMTRSLAERMAWLREHPDELGDDDE